MQTRSTPDENSVCPSVCLSVKRVHCDKKEERSVHIFILCERSFNLVFWEEWLVGATPSTWNFGSVGPRWNEISDFEPVFAGSASAVTPSEKSSVNTNRKSTGHKFLSFCHNLRVWHADGQRDRQLSRTVKRIGEDRGESGLLPIGGEVQTVLIQAKICMEGNLPDIIMFAKFQN